MNSEATHFEIFHLPRSYRIDLAELNAVYERLSLETHPDFFATAGEEERARAETQAADLNEAYRVLNSDAGRSAYLLGLLGAEHDLNGEALPEGFLSEMFELQEELDELEAAPGPERTAELLAQVERRLAALLAEREPLFAELERGRATEALQAAQTNLNCEKYLRRLLARLA